MQGRFATRYRRHLLHAGDLGSRPVVEQLDELVVDVVHIDVAGDRQGHISGYDVARMKIGNVCDGQCAEVPGRRPVAVGMPGVDDVVEVIHRSAHGAFIKNRAGLAAEVCRLGCCAAPCPLDAGRRNRRVAEQTNEQ